MIKKFIGYLKSFWYKSPNKNSNEEELIIAPCVGDIVEFEDGTRSIVMVVNIDESNLYDVRFSKGLTKCVNNRGRQRHLLEISKESESWPPKNSKVFRDSQLLIPQKKWRINFIVWLSSKLLK